MNREAEYKQCVHVKPIISIFSFGRLCVYNHKHPQAMCSRGLNANDRFIQSDANNFISSYKSQNLGPALYIIIFWTSILATTN